ncbi:MAG: sugar phosphate isomerase/epimerase [Parasporobacterium sp.]|nr:sugar phosphate isomerase/epimerase [Parasporobacterium sp.]
MNTNDRIKLGIQMFNFLPGGDWEQLSSQEEVEELLSQIAAAGYDGVEWCNFLFREDFPDLISIKKKMDTLGLETVSLHFHLNPSEPTEETARTAVKRCRLLGTDKLIFAYSLPTMFGIEPDGDGRYTPEQIDDWAVQADQVLSVLKNACEGTGINVLYHNHKPEFLTGTQGRYFMDLIHPHGLEPDVYWVSKGLDGKVSSALDYIRIRRKDVALLHVKDGLNGSVFTGEMCGWGKGTFPLQTIVDCAKELDLDWIVIENDAPKNFGTSGLEDARESAAYAAAQINFRK